MPGFNINGSDSSASDPNVDALREHRFVLQEFLGERVDSSSPFFYLIDVELPSKILNTISVVSPSTTYQFPKSVSFSDLRLTFYALKDLIDKINELEDKIHTADDGMKDYNEYMGSVSIALRDGKGSNIKTFKFENAFINDVNWGRLSYASSEIKTVALTVKFSRYISS